MLNALKVQEMLSLLLIGIQLANEIDKTKTEQTKSQNLKKHKKHSI